MGPFEVNTPSHSCIQAENRRSGHPRPQTCISLGFLLVLIISLLGLGGCAEVTKPTPTAPQIEAAQLDTARRHPFQSWSGSGYPGSFSA